MKAVWHPASHRPPRDILLLVTIEGGLVGSWNLEEPYRIVSVGWIDDYNVWRRFGPATFEASELLEGERVTAWAELPDPPERKEA